MHLNDNITDIQKQNNKNIEIINKKIVNLNTKNFKISEKFENDLKELSDNINETNKKLNNMELLPKIKVDESKKNVGTTGEFIKLREELLS